MTQPAQVTDDVRTRARLHTRIRTTFWILGLVLAAVQAWVYRGWVNGDAISYFDMSDAVAAGHWSRLVNGAWSPLYPVVVGVVDAIVRPTAHWEFPAAHLANFICFVFAFATFELLLREVLRIVARRPDHLPTWAILTVGYALFLWGSIALLSLMKPTPDMLMSGFLYLALALLLRIQNGRERISTYVALGIALALGYLAKTIMFPLGIVMLGVALGLRPTRAGAMRMLLAAGIFVVLSAPFIAAQSRLAGRLTIGESAKVVHLTYIDDVSAYWQSPGTATGQYLHAPRRIFTTPAAYEFARPITSTYPLWYDPTYWVEGVHPAFQRRAEVRTIESDVLVYVRIVLETIGLLAAAVVLLWRADGEARRRTLLRLWPLWVVSCAALGAYALVHVEERYVGAFFLLVWLAILAPMPWPRHHERLLRGAVAIVLVTLAASTVVQLHRDAHDELYKTRYGDDVAAVALTRAGVVPGERVARVSSFVASGWARLARVSVIAEVARHQVRGFWKAPAAEQDSVLRAFAAVGARAVVADVPPGPVPAGWQRLGTSRYAVYLEPGSGPVASRR